MISFAHFKTILPQRIQGLRERIKYIQAHRGVWMALRIIQALFVLGTILYLGQRMGDIGWSQVLEALPTSPWYYIFFLGWYFALPIAELSVYRRIWGMSLWRYWPAFLRKRVYNKAIFNYTGEGYVAFWAHKALPLRGRAILSTVKDSNLLSGLISNSTTLFFLMLAYVSGSLEPIMNSSPELEESIAISAITAAILVPLVARFRKKIISLPGKLTLQILSFHLLRNIAEIGFQAGMWIVVLPDMPISVWVIFLTAQLVLTRIPLPNTDLMLVGLGMSLSGLIDAPAAVIAGMFLAAGAINQILNVVIYIGTSYGKFAPVKNHNNTDLAQT